MKPRIRLGCDTCDRGDHDFLTEEELSNAEASGWMGVTRVQSYEDSIRVYDDPRETPPGYCVLDWWTHLGTCPDCRLDELGIESEGGESR